MPFKEIHARRRTTFSSARLATLWALAVSSPANADDLCRPPKTTIFACRMGTKPGARIASLCADKSQKPWRLTYRFGTPVQIELTYPAPGEPPAFRHALISYSGLGGDAVLFTRGPVTYALFYVLGSGTEFDGVAVRKGETKVANLSCAHGSLDELTTDFFKGAGLQQESAPWEVPEGFFKRYEASQRSRR